MYSTAQPAHQYERIPKELRDLPIWVNYRLEERTNSKGVVKTVKVPYNSRTGKHAKSNDPKTWSSYDEALAALETGSYGGIGICLTQRYVGVDLDGCVTDGIIEPQAQTLVDELNSFTEFSPSRKGLHIIVTGDLPKGRRQKGFEDREHHGVGLYDAARGRFLTLTGQVIRDTPIAERTAELQRIHARLFPSKAKQQNVKPQKKAKSSVGNARLTDEDLIARAKTANDGGKFARLWEGHWEGEYASQSEADLALCMKLVFWAGRDAQKVDALFRMSGLMRDKWNRDDYRKRTIAAALEHQTETYTGSLWNPPAENIVLAASAVEPSIEVLNAMPLFHRKIQFQSISRRGSMIIAITVKGQQINWPTMTDLMSFHRARAAIAEGADVLLDQPPRNKVSAVWDPAARMIIRLAAQDAIRVDHVLKAECKDLLILMWRYAAQPNATTSEEFIDYMIKIRKAVRDKEAPAPPCVFTAEEFCWVHLPTFRNWLSLPSLTNRLYPFADIRQGLLLLGFVYEKDVTRGADGESESASLWRGPIDVLTE